MIMSVVSLVSSIVCPYMLSVHVSAVDVAHYFLPSCCQGSLEVTGLVDRWRAYEMAPPPPMLDDTPRMTREQRLLKVVRELLETEREHVKVESIHREGLGVSQLSFCRVWNSLLSDILIHYKWRTLYHTMK